MNLSLSLAVFFMMWWIVLFAILPFWVQTPAPEQKEDVHFAGAPEKSHILRKFLVNTLVTAVLFAVLYSVIEFKLLSLSDFPFGPEFGEKYK